MTEIQSGNWKHRGKQRLSRSELTLLLGTDTLALSQMMNRSAGYKQERVLQVEGVAWTNAQGQLGFPERGGAGLSLME